MHTFRSRIILLTCGLLAAGASILPVGPRVHAAQNPFFVFGPSAISPGETARLNVVSVGVRETVAAQLVFFDSSGTVLTQTTVQLAPGRVVSLDLGFVERSATGNRMTFYPMVRLGARTENEGYVLPTLEVFDNATGRTSRLGPDPAG